jgi:type II secretory ATPase GspE/PulE/Tfp pilus assembly ATPase PilB-like protein
MEGKGKTFTLYVTTNMYVKGVGKVMEIDDPSTNRRGALENHIHAHK